MPLSNAFTKLSALVKIGNSLSAATSPKSQSSVAYGLPIGIDFGTSAVKVLQMQAGEPPSLTAAALLETPDEVMADAAKRLEFQTKSLPKLIRSMSFRGRRAVCAIPAWATVCKHMQLSKPDGKHAVSLSELVAQQLPLQMNCDPSSVVYRFLEVSRPNAARPEVIVMAVSRDLVEQLMVAIKASKLEPVGMQSEFAAAIHAFDHMHRRDGDLNFNTLYLDIGQGTTTVAISHGVSLAFARVIDLGGGSLDATLARQLDCSIKEARRRRWALNTTDAVPQALTMAGKCDPRTATDIDALLERRTGAPIPTLSGTVDSMAPVPSAPDQGDLTEAIEMLTDEIRMCLRYHAAQFPDKTVQRAVFIGGESRHRGLAQHIAQSLKLPAQIADPLARIARTGKEPMLGVELGKPQPGWTVAMGLCLAPTDL